jgi:hypothetical protein
MSRFCSTLRRSTGQAPPSIAVCTNRPRWVRWDAGRSQSATESTTSTATVTAATASPRCHVTRVPATSRASTAKPGMIAGGPPKSLPSPGNPSITVVTTPIATTATTACVRRPARTAASATAIARSRAPVANSANPGLDSP